MHSTTASLPSYLQQQAFQYKLEKAKRVADVAWLPDDPVAWIQREFYIPETQAALQLEPYQQVVLRKAFERDADGLFRYSLILWADLKKSAKSTIAGAAMLWLAWHHEWETCRVVGNDLKQADSRTAFYIRRAIELNRRLKAQCATKNYHIETPRHTTIEAIAVDPKGEAGGGDLMICFTELWAAKNEAAKQLWTETTLSPLKYGRSLRWAETYAGFEGNSPILEQLYATVVKDNTPIPTEIPGLGLYENGRTLCLWNTVPRCPWQTPDYYAQQAAELAPEEFNRVHRNQWATSTSAFIHPTLWDACKGDLPERQPHEAMVLGIDAAVSHDCFALVGVTRRKDICYVRYVKIWTPVKGKHIDFSEVEAELRRVAKELGVVCFPYDPAQFEDMAQRLTKDGVGWFDPFMQGADRLEADSDLRKRILTGTLMHDGADELRTHVLNADAKIDEEGHKLRIVHRAPNKPMDATVALSQACKLASYLNIG